MNQPVSKMTIIRAAGPVSAQALDQSQRLFISRSSGDTTVCPAEPIAREWLRTEDEYFPFDADSFEER